jgi:hypothetical protein
LVVFGKLLGVSVGLRQRARRLNGRALYGGKNFVKQSPIEPDGILDGLHWSPILRWGILDVVLTMAVVLPVMFYVAGAEVLTDDEEGAYQAIDAAVASSEFLLWSIVLGLSVTVFTSFRAARAADAFYLRHGGWTAVAAATFGALFLFLPGVESETQAPLWYDAMSYGLMLPAGVLGGWLASIKSAPAP